MVPNKKLIVLLLVVMVLGTLNLPVSRAADPVTLEGYQVLSDAVDRQGLARSWQV